MKLDKIKQKFDRDGVNFVQDEGQIGRQQQPQSPSNLGPRPIDAPPMQR